MPVAQSEVSIAAPPEEVWSLISDLERGPEWSLATLECKLTSEGAPGLGATYRSVSKFVASRVTTEHEIVEWVPPRKMVSKVVKGGESTFTQLCEPEGEGAILTMINDFSLPAAVPGFVAERLAEQVSSLLADELARIKEVVEQAQERADETQVEGASRE
ncbi:MAG TPA: SRPBCC family protein [Anaerolineae bacterium]|nr:SRPBCC family protein [Anaerolineae bacterium]